MSQSPYRCLPLSEISMRKILNLVFGGPKHPITIKSWFFRKLLVWNFAVQKTWIDSASGTPRSMHTLLKSRLRNVKKIIWNPPWRHDCIANGHISLCYEGLDTMRRWQQAQQHLVWEGQCQQLPRASLCQLLYRALCSCHILPRNWNGITRQKEKRSRLVSFRIQWRLFPCYQHTTSFLHTRHERKEPAERSLHTKLWLYLWIGKFRIISDYLFSIFECRFQQGVHWSRGSRGRIDPDFLHSNVPY